jgi:hypothetical protein
LIISAPFPFTAAAYRFYALYDKVYRADILSHAYRRVRANKGSAGIDGVTFEAIENAEGEIAFMEELQEALKSKSYAPSPVRRVMVPKADGTKRPLGIPTIRDRVAQMAVKLVIEPIFEADFCDGSYGFRPKKSAHDAVNDIGYALNCGYNDFVVLCRKGTEQPVAVIRRVLARLGLRLNEQKTRVVNAKQEGFDFLGFEFRMRASWRTGKTYPHVEPSKKSLQKIKSEVTVLTHRRLSVLPLPVVMKKVNEALKGWTGYFHYRNCSRSLEQVKGHAE